MTAGQQPGTGHGHGDGAGLGDGDGDGDGLGGGDEHAAGEGAAPWSLRLPAGLEGPVAVRAWIGLAVLCALAIALVVVSAPAGYLELPFAHRAARTRMLLGAWDEQDVGRARLLLDLGYGIIPLVVGLFATACFWRAGVEPKGTRRDGFWRRPTFFAALAGAAGITAIVQNVLYERTISSFRRDGSLGLDPDWLFVFAFATYLLLGLVLANLLTLLPQRLPPPVGGPLFGRSEQRPEFLRAAGAAHPWEPPAAGRPRVGISCSGGGLRSASFSLGALQALRDRGVLERARYLAAVSGGCYLATGLATARRAADAPPPAPDEPAPFASGSPEERWLRANTSYLAPDRSTLVAGLARLLGGIGLNLILIWLLLFAVARPVGWFISADAVHPELRAREPLVEPVGAPREDRRTLSLVDGAAGRTRSEVAELVERAAAGEAVPVAELDIAWDALPVDLRGREITERQVRLPLVSTRSGLVVLDDGRLRISRQPRLTVDNAPITERFNSDGRDPVAVATQPAFRFDDDGAIGSAIGEDLLSGRIDAAGLDALTGRLSLERAPELLLRQGVSDRPPLRFDRWMVGLPATLAGAALLLFFVQLLRRDERWPIGRLIAGLAAAAALSAAVLLALPAAVVAVPRAVDALAGLLPGLAAPAANTPSSWADMAPGALGFVVVAGASLRTYLQRRSTQPGRLLRWTRVLAALAVPLVALVLFVDLVELAAANGPFGHFAGLGLGLVAVPDWLRWIGVLALLVALWRLADAHAWSMYPFYKERLQAAYVLERRGGRATPIPYAEPIWFSDHPDLGGGGPQLVVCAAANLSDAGKVPPGRRSVSFTFSSTEVGGPQVGYLATTDLERVLSPARQRDVTMVAAMAISGAAVSPAMGKLGVGPLGRLFAVLNLRLGVWLPHPEWVRRLIEVEAPTGRWVDRPGWPYFVREVLGRFRFADRYLYVSDGGHWENLGLVELLRRGCTDLYCVSAAGDGPTSFGTIAEAIGLAREELGVEIEIELSDLRAVPGPGPAGTTPGEATGAGTGAVPATPVIPAGAARRLLRRSPAGGDELRPFAARPYAVGRVLYPGRARHDGRPVEGRIVVIEANLTDRIPWDVQGFAESTERFPDESTGDQFFDHRQFEAYRRLGAYQMQAALDAVDQLDAIDTRDPAPTRRRPRGGERRAAGSDAGPPPGTAERRRSTRS
ncbi:MAG: hypothetical protein R2749_19190 [Acidimicrobiales bacterium]